MPISLKVNFVAEGVQKVLNFNPDATVAEVLKEIRGRSNVPPPEGHERGLLYFGNPDIGKNATWLEEHQTLRNYFLKNGVSSKVRFCVVTQFCTGGIAF